VDKKVIDVNNDKDKAKEHATFRTRRPSSWNPLEVAMRGSLTAASLPTIKRTKLNKVRITFPRICIWESMGEVGVITCFNIDNVEV